LTIEDIDRSAARSHETIEEVVNALIRKRS